jgi:hypothetical protein
VVFIVVGCEESLPRLTKTVIERDQGRSGRVSIAAPDGVDRHHQSD